MSGYSQASHSTELSDHSEDNRALLSTVHGEVLAFCHDVTRSHRWTFPKQYTYPLNKTSTVGNTSKQFMQHYTCAFGETFWSDVRPVS